MCPRDRLDQDASAPAQEILSILDIKQIFFSPYLDWAIEDFLNLINHFLRARVGRSIFKHELGEIDTVGVNRGRPAVWMARRELLNWPLLS